MNRLKVHIAIAFFLVGLAVFFGSQRLLHQVAVDKPLEKQLAEIEGVRSFAFDKHAGEVDIRLSLDAVNNLAQTYERIEKVARTKLGNRFGTVIIVDNANSHLRQCWYEMHYAIEEAASTGSYSDMRDEVTRISREKGVTPQIWVGARHLYIQLHARASSLYRIVERHDINLTTEKPT